MLKKLSIVSLAMVGVFCFAFTNVGAQSLDEPVHMRFTSMPIGSSWYVQAATIAKIVREKLPPKSTIDVLPLGGGIGANLMVAKGKAEIGLGFGITSNWAYAGKVAYKEPLTNLRALVGGIDHFYQAIIIREGLGITSLKDIKDKQLKVRMFTVPPSGAGAFGAGLLLDAYGMSFDYLKDLGGKVEHTTFAPIIAAFKDGRADLFSHTISIGHPATTEIAVNTDVSFLSVEPEIMAKMEEYGYVPGVLPAGTFKGQDEDVHVPRLSSNVIVSTEMSDELAYLITKMMCENKAALAKGHPAFKKFQPKKAWDIRMAGVKLHSGAEKYYREMGWLK